MDVVIADGFWDSFRKCFRAWWHPKELWYKFKCWSWYRYTTIKPRSLNYHTWCDRGPLMAHMMFEILSQFIEKECSPGRVEWDYGREIIVDGKKKYVRDEMQELYDWWHQQYLKRYVKLEKQFHRAHREHSAAHQLSEFREEGDIFYWEPLYDTPENTARGEALLMRLNYLERAVENALNRRLPRILAIRDYMWT